MTAQEADPIREVRSPASVPPVNAAAVAEASRTASGSVPAARALRHSAWLTLGTLTNQAASLLLFLVAARETGPTEFGPVVAAIGLATVAIDFTDLGLNNKLLRDLSRTPTAVQLIRSAAHARTVTVLGVATLWIVLSPIVAHRVGTVSVFVLAGYTALSGAESLAMVPLKATGRMRLVGLLTALDRLVAATVGLVLIWAGAQPATTLTISLAVGAGTGLALALSYWPAGQLRAVSRAEAGTLRDACRGTLSFGITGLLTDLQLADAAVVQAFAGPTAAGLLAIPARLTGPLGTLSASFSAALFPRVAKLHESERRQRQELVSGVWLLIPITISLLALWIMTPLIITTLFGVAYHGSTELLRLFLPGVLLASINAPLGSFLQASGDERFVARIITVTVIGGFIALALLASRYGATGGPVAYVGLQATVAVLLSFRVFHRGQHSDTC